MAFACQMLLVRESMLIIRDWGFHCIHYKMAFERTWTNAEDKNLKSCFKISALLSRHHLLVEPISRFWEPYWTSLNRVHHISQTTYMFFCIMKAAAVQFSMCHTTLTPDTFQVQQPFSKPFLKAQQKKKNTEKKPKWDKVSQTNLKTLSLK